MKTLEKNSCEIHTTQDYGQFKFLGENRNPEESKAHVKELIASIERKNKLSLNPIIVNSDMFIVDGQHRFLAAKELGLPIHYMVDDDYEPSDIISLNTSQKSWTVQDFTRFYISQGYDEYRKMRDFMEETNLPFASAMVWVCTGENKYKTYRKGQFVFQLTENKLKALEKTDRFITFLEEANFQPTKIFNQREFHEACASFFGSDAVDADYFFERLPRIPIKIVYTRCARDYKSAFVEMYNHGLHKNKRISLIEAGRFQTIKLQSEAFPS